MSLRTLKPCSELWGRCELLSTDPKVELYGGAQYLPFSRGATWGLFDRHGEVIRDSVDWHGPLAEAHGQLFEFSHDMMRDADRAPDPIYVYGGTNQLHYGHFIVNVIARYWQYAAGNPSRFKILMHGDGNPADWLKVDFIGDAFGALGLTAENFVNFHQPTVIPQIIVPAPSFQEQHFVHSVFAKLGQMIGRNLLGANCLTRNRRPAYLTKTGLLGGVGHIVNELEIVTELEREGVEIIYPERLSLREKIRLFAERDCVSGVASSAFHTTIFWPARSRAICLNATSGPNSNFQLLDLATGSPIEYFYPEGTTVVSEENKAFLTSLRMENTTDIAHDLLHLMNREALRKM